MATINYPMLGASLPEVHSINPFFLEKQGWKPQGRSYTKGEHTLHIKNGKWMLDNITPVEFMEDINKIIG